MLKSETTGENRGGILADDMGLGKTIQSIALMLSNQPEKRGHPTLIIAPVSLIHQWSEEIKNKVRRSGKLSNIHIYHGSTRAKSVSELKTFDVVLTTYG
jgi:SNF2 family DNA or RNA helicase